MTHRLDPSVIPKTHFLVSGDVLTLCKRKSQCVLRLANRVVGILGCLQNHESTQMQLIWRQWGFASIRSRLSEADPNTYYIPNHRCPTFWHKGQWNCFITVQWDSCYDNERSFRNLYIFMGNNYIDYTTSSLFLSCTLFSPSNSLYFSILLFSVSLFFLIFFYLPSDSLLTFFFQL